MHFLAERGGTYAELGLDVELVDLRESDAPHDASVACGSALFDALNGASIQILLIASTAPLFWLYGPGPVCARPRIATYPGDAPPGRFLGLAIDDVSTLVPARDDASRLALVRAGAADCALLSSGTPPGRVPELRQLFCLGDRVPVPSTGLAASLTRSPEVDRLVEAHRRALRMLHADGALARDTARDAFGFNEAEAAWAVGIAQRYFTPDGRVPAGYLQDALRVVGTVTSPYADGVTRDVE